MAEISFANRDEGGDVPELVCIGGEWGIVWYCVVLCGIVWYCVVFCGIVWYGVVYDTFVRLYLINCFNRVVAWAGEVSANMPL